MRILGFRSRSTCLPAALLLLASLNVRAAGPDPNQPYVKAITYAGSGCPQGTAGTSISNDRQTFTLIFDSFVSSMGAGVPEEEKTKGCTVTLRLHLAAGWQTWTQAAVRRGYAQLPAGATATSKATYGMGAPSSGPDSNGASGINQTSQSNFTGPVAKDYTAADGFSITAHAPNTCNEVPEREQDLVINLETGLNGAGQAQITIDSLDGNIAFTSAPKSSKSCK